jgi:hypothetical protein
VLVDVGEVTCVKAVAVFHVSWPQVASAAHDAEDHFRT